MVVRINPRYFRPSEVEQLQGDPSKAFKKLKWMPSTTLEELIKEMISFDKKEAEKESILKKEGFKIVSSMENPPFIKN